MATAYDRRSTRPRLDSLRSTTSSSIPPPSSPSHPARPPSPSFSQTTSGSLANGTNAPHLIINRSDLRDSLRAYEDLMEAGKTYRRALLEKSQASARLAGALEVVSRLKGADHSGPGFMATAGFHYVVSNSEQVLGDSFYKSFEIPLLHTLDTYRQETIDRQASYEQALVAKTKLIREIESANLKSAGKKAAKGKGGRDLNSFRKTLELLQAHVHELDMLKMEYHGEVLDAEDEIWETILGKVGMVVKTQLEMMDKISMKANDSVLEPLLAANPDPFEAYAQPDQDALMFSILPP
ncbi:hypothetical protein BDY24DRAFT_338045 [Mrakia frigida]|uniref:Ivy1p n=1 Tax=Mrakia frigida TaxID=29902 RepID=UPI003FCBF9D3